MTGHVVYTIYGYNVVSAFSSFGLTGFYGVPFVSKLKKFEGLRFMLVFTTHDAGIYDRPIIRQ